MGWLSTFRGLSLLLAGNRRGSWRRRSYLWMSLLLYAGTSLMKDLPGFTVLLPFGVLPRAEATGVESLVMFSVQNLLCRFCV